MKNMTETAQHASLHLSELDVITVQSAGLRRLPDGTYASTLYTDTDDFGMLGGFVKSNMDFKGTSTEVDYSGATGGAYLTYLQDAFYIDALVKAGLRERVKVMIGGAPVSQAFADEIGADGYAKDSTLAVVKAKQLVGVAVRA